MYKNSPLFRPPLAPPRSALPLGSSKNLGGEIDTLLSYPALGSLRSYPALGSLLSYPALGSLLSYPALGSLLSYPAPGSLLSYPAVVTFSPPKFLDEPSGKAERGGARGGLNNTPRNHVPRETKTNRLTIITY